MILKAIASGHWSWILAGKKDPEWLTTNHSSFRLADTSHWPCHNRCFPFPIGCHVRQSWSQWQNVWVPEGGPNSDSIASWDTTSTYEPIDSDMTKYHVGSPLHELRHGTSSPAVGWKTAGDRLATTLAFHPKVLHWSIDHDWWQQLVEYHVE